MNTYRHERYLLSHLSSFIIPIHPSHQIEEDIKKDVLSELERIKNQCNTLREMINSY